MLSKIARKIWSVGNLDTVQGLGVRVKQGNIVLLLIFASFGEESNNCVSKICYFVTFTRSGNWSSRIRYNRTDIGRCSLLYFMYLWIGNLGSSVQKIIQT